MSAAAKRTLLAAVSVALLGAVTLAGAAGGALLGKRDRIPPTPPQNVHVLAATPSVVSTAWDPSQDDVGVAGYYVYHDTGRATAASPSYMVTSLDCGQGTAISVVAFDRAGNRSARVSATIATASCPDAQPPTTPSGFSQAATTQNEVVLTWTPSSDDVGVVDYGVYRNVVRIASPAEPTVTLSGLSCGSSYDYAVDAADAAGNRSLLGTAYVQTASCSDGQPPSAPADLAVTATTQTSVSVAWSPSSDDVGVAGYHVRKGGTLVSTGTQTSATVSGLACGATATIAVDAFDAAGNQSPQSTTSATTDACTPPPPPPPPPGDTTPPSQPSGLAVSSTNPTSVSLSWAASSDDVSVSGYGVYVNGSPVSSVTQLAATVSNLTCATTYTLAVDAYDAAGNRSSRASLSAASASCSAPPPPPPPPDTTPPSKPALALGPQTQTTLELDWQAATDNVGVDHYNVWLGHSGSSDFAKIAQTPATQLSYVYQGLTCATAYTLGLEAVDAAGNKSLIGEATWGPVSTLACSAPPPPPPPPPSGDTSPPTQPANLGISSATRTSVSLTWTASSDNVGVSGYGTYVNNVAGPTSTQLGATFSSLSCGTAYTFEVDAADAAGNRSTRASVTGSTAACADTQPPSAPTNVVAGSRTATSIALSWSASSDNVGVTGYGLYRGGAQTATTAATNGIFSGLTCNTNYTLAVDAYDAAANHSTQTVVMVSTTVCPDASPPSAPTNLAASNVSQTGLTLAWNASSDNVAVTGYDVYRNTTKMATLTTTSSSQTGLACGTSYAFAVVALDAAGNSSLQAQLNASTSACSAPPPPPPTTVYVSASGNDANACAQASPCRSFNRAYRVAAPGATVEVAAGSYGEQVVQSDGRSPTSAYVVFAPAGSVTVSRLDVPASRVEFRDMRIARFYVDGAGIRNGAGVQRGVVFRAIDADTFCISGGEDIQIIGGDIGPSLSSNTNGQQQPCVARFPASSTPAPKNVLIQGVSFHDHNHADGAHTECIQFGGVDGAIVRNSTFRNCAQTASIHIGRYRADTPSLNVVIEGNFFYGNSGASSDPLGNIQYNRSEAGLVIRYNTFVGSGGGTNQYSIVATFDFHPPASPSARIYGNVANTPGHSQADSYGPCDSLAVYDHNVWRGASCSGTDLNVTSIGVVSLASDLHLLSTSPAIGRGNPSNHPTSDIDGQTRPIGAVDAGADER